MSEENTSVSVSASHHFKPVKRRKISEFIPPGNESAEPIPIYCSEYGRFYCYVGSEEVRSDTMKELIEFLRDRGNELDTELLLFEPKIKLWAYEGKFNASRLLFARHKTSGRLYQIVEWSRSARSREEYLEWSRRCEGPDWTMAYADGIKKGWTRCSEVTDIRNYERYVDYTEDRWSNARQLGRLYSNTLRELDRTILDHGHECLDAIAAGETPRLLSGD